MFLRSRKPTSLTRGVIRSAMGGSSRLARREWVSTTRRAPGSSRYRSRRGAGLASTTWARAFTRSTRYSALTGCGRPGPYGE